MDVPPQKTQEIQIQLRFHCHQRQQSLHNQLNLLLKRIENYELIHRGSSLKFCLIAKGEADLYPRLGPTSEWDTAAGEAIVSYAGGYISAINGNKILYNKKDTFINPEFLVSSDIKLIQSLAALNKKS